MSKRTEYLAGLFKNRDLDASAKVLHLTPEMLSILIGNMTLPEGQSSPKIDSLLAAAIGKLTDTDPRKIIVLQMEDELDSAGVKFLRDEVGLPQVGQVKEVKPTKAKKTKAAKEVKIKTSSGSKSPFGPAVRFKLD